MAIKKSIKITLSILGLVLVLLGIVFADTNGIWIKAEDIIGGVFGQDEDSQDFSFVNPVEFNESVTIKEDLEVNTIKSNPDGNIIIQLG
jgi:hypothetical protein